MDYKQAGTLAGVLIRIAEALEDIDSSLVGIEDALRNLKGEGHG